MTLVSPAYNGSSHFFLFVCVINFIATTLWSFIYLLGIRDVLVLPIDWYLTVSIFDSWNCVTIGKNIFSFFEQEFVNNAISAMMYAAAFIIQISTWVGIISNHPRAGTNIIGGFFGLLNSLFYAASSYYLYLIYKYDHWDHLKMERCSNLPKTFGKVVHVCHSRPLMNLNEFFVLTYN